MKTNNLKIRSILLFSILAAFISGCNSGTMGTYTGGDKKPLNITVTSNESIKFKQRSAGRTIVADPFETDEVTFYLWGSAQSGQTLNPRTVSVTSDDGVIGKVVLDIDCFNWSLTLAACYTAPADPTSIDSIMQAAVLIGYGNVDMMFTNNIKFTLTPKGLSKPGNVSLKILLGTGMEVPAGYNVHAYIYDMTTGAKITGTESEALDMALADFTYPGAVFNANGADIAPGTYVFQVEFTSSTDLREYVWNDTLIILPGKTVDKTITIPNLLGPGTIAPTDFTVEFNKYINNLGAETTEAEESKYPGFYTAHFSWNGEDVKTEKNFAIELIELADDLDISTLGAAINTKAGFEEVWDTPANYNAKYSFDYNNDIRADTRFYKGGSLFANNTYVDLYLELGKRYIARIFSENNAGYSTNASYLTIVPVEEDAVLDTINRFRVKYYTQGGTWNIGENHGAEPASALLDKINYWSQSDQSYTVLNPKYTTITDGKKFGAPGSPYLYNGPADWIYWITDLTSEEKYDVADSAPFAPVPYTDFRNLDLYASYSREGDVEIYNDKTYDILQAWVNAFGMTGTVAVDNMNVVSKGDPAPGLAGAENTTVSVTVPDSIPGDWKYDKVSFKISYAGRTYFNQEQVGAARNSANTFTIPVKNLPTGVVYNCLITARYQMTTVSYSFVVLLTD